MVDINTVKATFSEIKRLDAAIKSIGDDRRNKLSNLNVASSLQPIDGQGGTFDQTAWDAMSESEQQETAARLAHLAEALMSIGTEDEPRNPNSLMFRAHASNTEIWCFLGFGILLFAVLLWRITTNWDAATGPDLAQKLQQAAQYETRLTELSVAIPEAEDLLLQINDDLAQSAGGGGAPAETPQTVQERLDNLLAERQNVMQERDKLAVTIVQLYATTGVTEGRVIYMVILLGALGGASHFVGSFVKFVGNRVLMRSWLLHYLSLPFVGAGLAIFVYLLLRVGLLAPSGGGGDGSQLANLNLIGIYAFAALTGLFSGPATEKLSEIFRTMFRTESSSKDALKDGGGKPPSG